MSHVSVHYTVYIPGGHHRQPRNAAAQIEPNPPSEVDVQDPNGNITPLYIDPLPYTLGGGSGLAKLLFWSVTDGTDGQVYPAGPLTQPVGGNPLTITAWYLPISGPGVGGGNFIIDDAFSAAKGNFIDDTFVTVTNDPTLTSQANVVGIVPTLVNETLQSSNTVASTSEPFSQWISVGAGVANGATLNVPAKSTGIAIAIYQKSNVVLNKPSVTGTIFGTIFGGIGVDGDGTIVINGVPIHIGPWGPLLSRLIASATVAIGAEKLDKDLGAQVSRLAVQDALLAIKQVAPAFEQKASK